MGNILDYLYWRGDLTLQADPFNEVDNLVLSYLSYVNYDDVVPAPGQPFITVEELSQRFFAAHTPKELAADKSFVREAPEVLRAMAETVRFRDVLVGNFVNEIDQDRMLQMSATEIRLPDHTAYVAFRGTDDRIVSWKEDFYLAVGGVAAHRSAVRYVKQTMAQQPELEYRLGGHSKGAHMAVVAGAYCGAENQKRIREIYSNDGPGFQTEIFDTEEYQAIASRILRILPNESFVGMLLGHQETPVVIQSSAKGLLQHSGTTWQVKGGQFVRAEGLDGLSLTLDETMKQWLEGYNQQERIRFIDELFSVLEASGAETLTEVQKGGLSAFAAMKKQYDTLDGNTKTMIDALLQRAFSSWTEHVSGAWFAGRQGTVNS